MEVIDRCNLRRHRYAALWKGLGCAAIVTLREQHVSPPASYPRKLGPALLSGSDLPAALRGFAATQHGPGYRPLFSTQFAPAIALE